MGAERDRDGWIENFSFVLSRDALRQARLDPKYEVFAGSKPLAILWLAAISTVGGALGGMLVSGALWHPLWQPALWLVAAVLAALIVYRAARALWRQPLAFLSGWCLFWGMLVGLCALWAAQSSSSGWAYGIAGGLGFLIGITQGVYEPDDLKGHDGYFAVSLIGAPAAACLAAWLYRTQFGDGTLATVALAGAIAGLGFLGPVMAMCLARLDNVQGLKRFASMLLHHDETIAEALPVLDAAIRVAPEDATLFDRRALTHSLLGHDEAAEADWARHAALDPRSVAREIARGWVALRQDRADEAAAAFQQALARRRTERWALVGLGISRLRLGDPQGAIEALDALPGAGQDALSLSWLAEAQLAAGDAAQAAQTATDAIDELDSIHGRSWLVRARARTRMGDIDGAAKDYNKALWAADEPDIEDRAMAGLDEIGRPVEEVDVD